ncbi:RNA polymerase sigma factor [Streptomyces doebereineriae]|uniref:Sigma-70 family RNA polymerase sigma factor n=1 Tax=Streptomyces doebereineriae TaxID=3075528 RepID=A0ABU2V717_9ACTN|nr:sigma-70 family RNA polymerase sigma factor [Streptomyces sp. DSM 41640]MDT0481060.1 sigma-70 family RNA polymerase sigma factor [Streptomyces sp. DSM 41640]
MATDMPDMPAEIQAAHDRWQRMWSHREQLLKVARRRSMSPEDAEDAVHEAMLRAAERPDLDDERLGGWLTTVTMRLCVDRYRQVNRETEVHRSPTLAAPGPVPVEEAVCDRAEARWLAVRSGELPARQAEALRLKSEDLDVGQVAVRMGLSYRTVESLLARARRTLRNSLAGTLGLALFLWGRGRLRAGGHAQAVVVTSTAASLVVAGFVLPYVHDGDGQGTAPRPSVSRMAQATTETGPDSVSRVAAPNARDLSAASTSPAATPAVPPGDHDRSLLPLSVPPLPDASLSPVPSVPDVPGVSDLPSVSGLPDLPATSTVPTTLPSLPKAPATPPAPADVPTPTALP